MVTAGGQGRRLGGRVPKQFLPLAGRPLVERCLALFHDHPAVDDLVLTLPAAAVAERGPELRRRFPRLAAVVPGGAERQDSVAAALEVALPEGALVAVHDAARPLFAAADLEPLLAAAAAVGAAAPAVAVSDTVAEVDPEGRVAAYPDRGRLRALQTPQVFRHRLLLEAHRAARAAGRRFSDDTQAVHAAGHPVALLPGRTTNLKITTGDDLALAEALLARAEAAP